MHTLEIVLIILIPIAFLITIILFWIIWKTIIRNRKNTWIQSIDEKINKEKITKVGVVLTRVKTISKSNSEYIHLFKNLSIFYDEFEQKVRKALKQIASWKLSQDKVKYKKFKNKYLQIQASIEVINFLENKFLQQSHKVVQEDEFMRVELSFYSMNLRKVIEVYQQKRIFLNQISHQIDDILNKIKIAENEFNNAINSANTELASKELRKYSQYVIKLSCIINEGPSIQTYLYITMPQLMQDLIQKYKAKKLEISSSLEHINFKRATTEIVNKFNIAKTQYLLLNFNKTKEYIKNILKSMKILKRLINHEIKSRNIFIANYEVAIQETKQTLLKYASIKKQIQTIISKDSQLAFNFADNLISLQNKFQILDDEIFKFQKIIKLKKIAYSSKIIKMKMLLQRNLEIIYIINNVESMIWTINIKKIIMNNKFKQAETALNEIIVNTHNLHVILNSEEEQKFEELFLMLSHIAKEIVEDKITTTKIFPKIDDLIYKTTIYYKIVGGKIQLVQIVKNMIKELSMQRALDKQLHYQLSIAETLFLQGKYDNALNTIITHLEERK